MFGIIGVNAFDICTSFIFKGEVLTDIFYTIEQNVKISCVSHRPYFRCLSEFRK